MRVAKVEAADVYRGEEHAGRIERTGSGSSFAYLPNAKRDVAYGMTRRDGPFQTANASLSPFFAGLLPEGIRWSALTRQIQASADDLFAYLLVVGADCIGDVAVVPQGDPAPKTPWPEKTIRPKSVRFAEMLAESLQLERLGSEANVPGVQDKLSDRSVAIESASLRSPEPAIIKLNPAHFPRLVENEAFFLTLAKRAGLDVPKFEVLTDRDGASALRVVRFDRRPKADRSGFERIHQEDACQLLGKYNSEKYSISLRQAATACMEVASSGPQAGLDVLKQYAFSWLTGNSDLHGKNLSVYEPEPGLVTMTPAYDLPSTIFYRNLDSNAALKLDGRDANFKRETLLEFGVSLGVSRRAFDNALDRMIAAIEPAIDQIGAIGFDEPTTAHAINALRARLTRFRA